MDSDLTKKIDEIQVYHRARASLNRYATSPDHNLREVEIEYVARWMWDGARILDVGCGNGYSTLCHATMFQASFTGVDFVPEMIEKAKSLAEEFELKGQVEFRVGDITRLQFAPATFDIVVSERCLLDLPSKDAQWQALAEVGWVLKPGGLYLMLEGTLQGLQRLNEMGALFGLEPIPDTDPNYNWFSNKFDEAEMRPIAGRFFTKLEQIQRFGMYYFLSRVVHPLLVRPEQPKYDGLLNAVARDICSRIPDFGEMGHVALFVLLR
jgi:ubiquinone/menaquinone biosynthesis C-methylase UbiE